MDHAETLERIEIAAVEPDGLDRLMAGDTPDGAAVAGHLAGCPACTAELARIRRDSALVREAVRALPDPALRDRTLAYVRAVGRDRSAIPAEHTVPANAAAPAPAPIDIATARGWRGRYSILAGLAAAVVIASVLGFASAGVVLAPGSDGDGSDESEIAVLSTVTETSMRIEHQSDATHLILAPTDGEAATTATLLFSPSQGELVIVADGLAPLPAGMEYGCWVEVDGQRRRIGRMYPGGDVQGWAGPVDGLEHLPAGTVFGVSLVPVGGGAGEPVLIGRL